MPNATDIVATKIADATLPCSIRIAIFRRIKKVPICTAPAIIDHFTISIIEFKEESFLNTIRKKLLWGEDKRN